MMDIFIDKLYDFVKTGFWHYCVALELALLWFILADGRKNTLLRVFVIGFLCTLAFHTLLRNLSSRYMLVPTLLALPIIAFFAVALKRFLDEKCRWRDKCRWGMWIFCLLAIGFATLSFLKFNRKGRQRRDTVIMHAASLIRDDFKKRSHREALLIGNSDDTGLMFIYAGIPGKSYNYAAESGNPQRFYSLVWLHCSQYPLVYILKEQKNNKYLNNSIFNHLMPSPHSYRKERLDRGNLDPQKKYGRVELYRIESQIGTVADRVRIAEFLGTPSEILKNGEFSQWQESRSTPDAQFGNRFLAAHPMQLIPAEWSVDFNQHRGADFTKWSFAYKPPREGAANGVWRIHAPRGGFALKSRTILPADKDCRLKVAAELSSGCKLLVFLYVLRKDHSYLTAQPVGVYHCEKPGDQLLSFPILRDSLPADGAFFLVGLIGWQGDFSLKKLDVVFDDLKE